MVHVEPRPNSDPDEEFHVHQNRHQPDVSEYRVYLVSFIWCLPLQQRRVKTPLKWSFFYTDSSNLTPNFNHARLHHFPSLTRLLELIAAILDFLWVQKAEICFNRLSQSQKCHDECHQFSKQLEPTSCLNHIIFRHLTDENRNQLTT